MGNTLRSASKRASCSVFIPLAGLFTCLPFALSSRCAHAQTEPAAEKGGVNIFAGVVASSYTFQKGEQKVDGAAAFVDLSLKRPLGLEAEARWLGFNQADDMRSINVIIGPRYHWKSANYQVYVKALAGAGDLRFSDNPARGRSIVIAPGGGVDFMLIGRLRIRLVDVEYQYWPQIIPKPVPSYGISTGLRFRVY